MAEERKLTLSDFKKVKVIGEGSYGQAVLYTDKDGQQVIIKEISLGNLSKAEAEAVQKEIRILRALHHPNIVEYRGSFVERKICYIVMEFADGGDLCDKIEGAGGKHFTEDQILDWFTQICLALKHCHDRKILHRDLKTQNIFLTSKGLVKLGDFGIAKELERTTQLAKTAIGTPYYLSPEICSGKAYNAKSDVWSLGCVLYELCTLQHPFDANNINALVVKIVKNEPAPISREYSPELQALIKMCLNKLPKNRPTVGQLLNHDLVKSRIPKMLSETMQKLELSHTVFHGLKSGEEPEEITRSRKEAKAKPPVKAAPARSPSRPSGSGSRPLTAKEEIEKQKREAAAVERNQMKAAKEKKQAEEKKKAEEEAKKRADHEAARKKKLAEKEKELADRQRDDREREKRRQNLEAPFKQAKMKMTKQVAADPGFVSLEDPKQKKTSSANVAGREKRVSDLKALMKKGRMEARSGKSDDFIEIGGVKVDPKTGQQAKTSITEREEDDLTEFMAITRDVIDNPPSSGEDDDADDEAQFIFKGKPLDLPSGNPEARVEAAKKFICDGIGKSKYDAAYKFLCEQSRSDASDADSERGLKKILSTPELFEYGQLIQQIIAIEAMK